MRGQTDRRAEGRGQRAEEEIADDAEVHAANEEPSPLLVALKRAGEGDLAALKKRIGEIERELDMLRLAQKIIDKKINGGARAGAGTMGKAQREELADKMVRVIQQNGPGKPKDVGAKLGINPILAGKIAAGFPDIFRRNEEGKITLV